jgi:uncharacterized protein YndB with AHSA1/START domain
VTLRETSEGWTRRGLNPLATLFEGQVRAIRGIAMRRGERVIMTTTTHTTSVRVNAPVEKVFDYVKDPAHFLGAFPHQEDLVMGNVTMAPEGVGTTYEWTDRELGIKISGVSTRAEYVVNHRIVDKSSTGPVWTWTFEPDGSGTTLTLMYEYSSKIPLVDKVVDAVMWHPDRDLPNVLAVIKERVEASAA